MFKQITIKGKNYNLKLTSRALVKLERELGTNPVNLFMVEGTALPQMEGLIKVFRYSFPKDMNISEDQAFDLFDDFIEEGNDLTSFIEMIVEVFKVSGIIPKDSEVSVNSGN